MNLFYSIGYRLGFTPWENAVTHPPAYARVASLFDHEERGMQPPYGRALDLGCGRGHWAIVLAQRGWEVTGVERVAPAARAARTYARVTGLPIEIVEGDVTALRAAGLAPGYRLIWDFGTLHGMSPAQREATGEEVSALATEDATALILAWAPGRRAPLPRGASREDIQSVFPDWEITDESAFDVMGLPSLLRKVDPRVYRLRRKAT
ncbi:class I SAM-dependent methyltransferase [Thiohalobacter thiocyanaticus]|uniref:Class I SAM-dependent methyltransferase n=1 Tax=Thiohalobacter thiocyanaticus TaxID=585455 RepID=A0A426QJU4_9GAMM|nr:class I SAM-dependent methyltransferase [Thiohalobacter thiocyanaticus]RRQ22041.1 class I SAM-dependent methyltransferase [Thiohalobacter thiocyanaticus]